jgi:hypothetical protein
MRSRLLILVVLLGLLIAPVPASPLAWGFAVVLIAGAVLL